MSLNELLVELSARSIKLRRNGSNLGIHGTEEVLDAEFIQRLRTHKEGLLDLIDRENEGWWCPARIITPEMLPLVTLTAPEIEGLAASVPGGASNIQDIYPLSPLQEGILFHHLMAREGDAYLLSGVLAFDTRERLDAFTTAMQAVVDRHDILRTAMAWEKLPEPVQVVWRQATLSVENVVLDPTQDAAESLRDRFDPRRVQIDVRQAPMLRLYIARDDAKDRWLLLILLHHLAGDHSTLDVMFEEIQAHLLGQADQLPKAIPFRNLVAQARFGVSREEHETFFRSMLGDIDEPTAPFGLMDVQGDGTGIREAHLGVTPELSKGLRKHARRMGVSAASLCHQAWAQVLARLTGRENVVFGTVLFGRMQGGEGSDRGMGLFINTLPVRMGVGEEGTEASVRRTHRMLADLMRHEHASLALAQRCSAVQAPAPLFTTLLNYRHSASMAQAPSAETRQAWEGIEVLSGEERTNYPLTLSVGDLGEGFALTAQVHASIDPLRVCNLMHTALERLVEALETAPTTSVRSVDVLPEAERRLVVETWNATEAEFPHDRCVHELFEDQVKKTPQAIALVHGEQSLTYAELNARSNRLAHHLRSLGVKPDESVALVLERSFALVVAELAILKTGGAYVPLDASFPEERLAFMLRDCGAKVLLTTRDTRFPEVDGVIRIDVDAMNEEGPAENVTVSISSEATAYIMYTSGSTGTPKGVVVPHHAIVRLVINNGYAAFEASDRVAFAANPAFDASTMEVWAPLLHGGSCVVIDQDDLLNSKRFAETMDRNRVSAMFITTALFNHYSALVPEAFANLRYLMTGGERSDPGAFDRVLTQGRPHHLVHVYGPTETTTFAISLEITKVASNISTIPIGRPIANTQVYLLDAHHQPVPIGVAGELYIGGAGVVRGYLNRPDLTAERFVADPFSAKPNARMYKTGDLGRWLPDGTIEFLGRNDFQVKIRGFRIELGEIEARLLEHPEVREAVVIAREDVPGDKRLVAYLTSDGNADLNAETLRAHLSGHLPEYMVPAAFVRLEALPLTPNGKLDRKALPTPEGDAYVTRAYEAPQGEIESKLAALWSELLKVERVGRHDNFFELGGHSLLAVQMVSRLRQTLNVEVPLSDLFAQPVLTDFARGLSDAVRPQLPPVIPAERPDRIPLSFAQQRLWFLAQMEGVSEAYHISGGLKLRGPLDKDAFHRALDHILARHEALRTTFALLEGEPVQRIAPAEESRFCLLEQSVENQTELERLVTEEASSPFDLVRGPLVRGRLIRESEDLHTLLITMHHIVSDGWSMGIFVNELSTLYRAYAQGETDALPALEVQYADYAIWQRRWISGELLQGQANYWKATLSGAPEVLELPTDHPRPAEQSYAGGTTAFGLDEGLTEKLKSLSRRHGTTLFMTLLAGWAALLSRLSGQEDLVIGTPSANRGRQEVEGLIGFFVNTLALRLDVSTAPTIAGFLKQVKDRTLEAQANQDIPFEQVVELAKPVRSLAHSPLFQVMFAWQSADEGHLEFPGLSLEPLRGTSHTVSKFDLTLSLQEWGGGIGGGLEYATALFERETAERIVGYYRTLLEGMVADETQRVDRLPLLPETERRLVVETWNATEAEFPKDRCVHELFEQQVVRTPDAIALVHGEQTLTYAELNARSNRLAHHLRSLGVKPDGRVAICVERSLEMVVGLLAVLKAGGAYVPMDPAYPAERLRHMLSDCEPVALLTQKGMVESLTEDLAEGLPILDLAQAFEDQPDTNPNPAEVGLTSRHMAYVIYTSGSTGIPKGVMIEHRNVARLFTATEAWFHFGPQDVWTLFHSYAFDFSVWEIWGALLYGGRLVVIPRAIATSPEDFYRLICREAVTVLNQTPSAFKQLMVAQSRSEESHHLRFVIFGGEALEVATLKPWYERNGDQTQLVNMYGITETTVHVTYRRLERLDTEHRGGSPIGCRIPDLQTYILDAHGQPMPIGVAGELYVGGAGVARGYLNRPDLTTERFVADPFSAKPNARMYKTGDLGRWLPDGTIEFLGRNDFQVKIRGFRIELGEIEARLLDHPEVREAVVIAREDVPGDKRLVAYLTSDADVGAETLRAHLLGHLPEYMVPAAFVRLEALPLTPNGKLDHKALPAPEGDAYVTRAYEAPQGEVEITLAAIWSEILKVERVGRHDNFFELGGHSLLAVTLIERMRQQGLQADVRTLFASPSLSALAASVGGEVHHIEVPPNLIPIGCTALTPEMLPLVTLTAPEIEGLTASVPGGAANIQDIYPLAPLQEGILFHHLMASEGDPYLNSMMLAFDTRERLEGFTAAMQAVMDRHDILRTAMAWEGLSEPVQVVWRQATLSVEEVVLDPTQDAAEQLRARFDPRHHRIDLRQAPMMRLHVARDDAQDRWMAFWVYSHLLEDHTTLDVMGEEIQAHLLGQADQLPKAIPFRNLVAQARLGVSREEHETFFRSMLGDIDEPTAPFGLMDVQGEGSGLQEACLGVTPDLSKGLRLQARRMGVSAASLCHQAWAQVLARLTGREDVVFGTVIFGRMQGGEGSDQGLGMFINTLPVRMGVGEDGTEASVRSTHRMLADLMRHEHASLALAQRCSAVQAPAPLFTTLLNYRHSASMAQAPSAETRQAWEGIKRISGQERTNYPMTLSVDDLGEEFALTAQVHASIDPLRVCNLMHTALERLVEALETAPTTSIRSVDVLPESERRLVVETWNATEAEFPHDRCVHELFEQQVAQTPDAIALVHGEQALTYKELNTKANRLAHHLRSLGVKPDESVALVLERSFALVVAELAILKTGGAYVPLDASFPEERLAFMLRDCGAKVLLTTRDTRFPEVDGVIRIDVDAMNEEGPAENVTVSMASEAVAYIMYTSGSTGTPKGVVVPHHAIVRLVINNGYAAFEASDRVAFAANPAFDASTMEVWAPLLHGAWCVIIDQEDLLDPRRFGHVLRHHEVNVLWMTVGLFNRYADELGREIERLRVLIVGGDALDPRVIARVLRHTRPQHLLNGYGPTETTTFALTHEIRDVPEGAQRIPIGRPIANTQVYLLDANHQPVPIGATGELYIGGAGVARGYLNRPDLTAERFVADPFSAKPNARMYKTGDLGRWLPDGTIEFLGRNDFQVKIRGFRIELGEIEARLLDHPEVREAVVIAREDMPGDKRLVAYLTSDGNADLNAETLRTHLLGHLPEYMVPAAFVRLEALPLTPNGKLDRKALPAPEGDAYTTRAYEAPQGEVEITLAAIWSELLKVERVGRHDNFFELGGHSLLAVTLIERMRQQGLQADVRTLFASPSLSGLAASVGGEVHRVEVPPNLIPIGCTALTPEMLPLVTLTDPEIEGLTASVPGGAANIQDIYPLSPLQEGILFHHLMAREGDAYLLTSLLAFDTRERLDAFTTAMQAVVDRHDILRTAVAWENLPEPVQVVWRQATLSVEEVILDPTQDAAKQLRVRFDPRHHRIDLRQAPLLRLHIARDEAKDRWLLLLLLHHLAGDHSTLDVMREEIQAFLLGQADQLPKAIPFRNLVAQARLGVSREEHETFFRSMLGDIDEPTAPFGLMDVQGDGTGIREAHLGVTPELSKGLRKHARRMGVSAASLCHQAWAQVLARLTGRENVVFGTVLFGRMQGGEGSDRGMGLFINTLPVRMGVGEEGTEASVRSTHRMLADLMRHEHASLALAQRCSAVQAPAPLFTALLNYRHSASAAQAPSAEAMQAWEGLEVLSGEERTNYPLTLSVDDFGEGFALTAQVHASIDPMRVCDLMHTALERLVEALETAPATPVRSVDVLPEAERRLVVETWNATEASFPRDRCVHELFEQQVAQTPDAIALVHGEQSLTYAELNARSNRLAHHLRSLGVKPDGRVAICVERSLEMVVGLLAVLKAGGAYVPMDPAYPAERLRHMLSDCEPVALLTQKGMVESLTEDLAEGLPILDLAQAFEDQPDTNPNPAEVGLTSRHMAYVIYTSGSTGIPKGVMIEHRNVARLFTATEAWFHFGPQDVWTLFHSYAFDFSVWEIWGALLYGGRLVVIPRAIATSPEDFYRLICREAVTVLNQTPSAFKQLMVAQSRSEESHHLRFVIFGGEALEVATLKPWYERNGDQTQLVNMYGITETTVHVTYRRLERLDTEHRGGSPIGCRIPDLQTYILDAHGQPMPIGVAGELYVGGAGVARGYLNRPDLTTERFVADPFSAKPNARMYKTGDLGRWLPDGTIEFLGRNDFQVKIRGFRIELGEIEARLLDHPEVREAVVIAREDVPGDKRLVAYLTSDADVGAETLRAHLLGHLPEYMVPAAFVRLEALPLTPNGKLDHKALPAPEGDAYVTRAYEAPQGEVEITLAAIWSEILKVERVGRHDNFFELGGHSLLAVTLIERMRQQGLQADVRTLFVSPSLSSLAASIGGEDKNVEVPPNLIPDVSNPNIFATKKRVRL